jgi:DNA-binding MarR family transcriptional regulator
LNTLAPKTLADKEFSIIQELVRDPEKTQRELSESVGISLGMTNIILKRLIKKGYLKTSQLNWNKTRYLLTFKGAAEKARKSYAYALYTLHQARKITQTIQDIVIKEYRKGARRAVVVSWPDTEMLIRAALAEKDLPGFEVEFVPAFKYVPADCPLVFVATIEPEPAPKDGRRHVPLLDKVDLQFQFQANGG